MLITSEFSWKRYPYHVRIKPECLNEVVEFLNRKYNTQDYKNHWNSWAMYHFGLTHEKDFIWITLKWT